MTAGLAVVLLAGSALAGQGAEYLDLAPFGKPLPDASSIGTQWDEERDVRQVWARFSGDVPANVAVEYWFKNWPYDPPKMPTIEDPVDDPWQGKWLRAKTVEHCSSGECTYDMAPLDEAENPRAKNLPGVRYRRTLKIRLVTASKVSALRVFSYSTEAPLQIKVESADAHPQFHVFNGRLRSAKPAGRPGAFLLDVIASKPAPAGSHDITIVTVAAPPRTFSFSVQDLRAGPINVPDFHALVTLAGQPASRPCRGRIFEK